MTDQPHERTKPPITDSPLFWLCLFGVMALAALVVVGPRYARRQGQLQQKWEARERIARDAAEQAGATSTGEKREPRVVDRPTLRPLFLVMACFVAVIAGFLVVQRIRR